MGYRSDLYDQSFDENRKGVLRAVSGFRVERMLDAGCGDGVFTAEIADRAGATEVHGIEIDPDRADDARTRGVKAEEATDQPLPDPAGHFDLIVSHHVYRACPQHRPTRLRDAPSRSRLRNNRDNRPNRLSSVAQHRLPAIRLATDAHARVGRGGPR